MPIFEMPPAGSPGGILSIHPILAPESIYICMFAEFPGRILNLSRYKLARRPGLLGMVTSPKYNWGSCIALQLYKKTSNQNKTSVLKKTRSARMA